MLTQRWQPLAEINQLRSEMDRLFGRHSASNGSSRSTYPAMNVWEDDNSLFVEAELPGFNIEQLEILVIGENKLTVKGERKRSEPGEGMWHRQERGFGSFSRVLELSHAVDSNNVDAEFENGVLTIRLPKCESAKARRITVKTK